ncbi:MAG: rhomboid family intramembrane serine protease [Verrucomicrobiota bacterium]
MRVIGHLESEGTARRFSDFLYVQGIANTIEEDGGKRAVWVHDDNQLREAIEWLEKFRAEPSNDLFASASETDALRNQENKDLAAFQKRMHSRAEVRKKFLPGGLGKLTAALMAISIGVALISKLGADHERIMPLFIKNWSYGGMIAKGLPEIQHGEVWRLFTPMFIHFGILHIIFNMMWLRDLGTMIESRESSWRLLFLVLIIAAGSNLAQFFIRVPAFPPLDGGHPNFGGMSGVIYGLFGYVWMRGKFDARPHLILHKSTVSTMMIWLVLCMTGLIGPIANLAHLFGLLIGMAAGFICSRLEDGRI